MRSTWVALFVSLLLSGCGNDRCHPNGNDVEDEDSAIQNGTCALEGTLFEDSFSCSKVGGPCPGSSGQASAKVAEDADRLADPDAAWARDQLGACSCVCCHHSGGIADHEWTWDFEPVWTVSAESKVLRELLEPVDEEYRMSPAKNNGFSVRELHLPTTDAPRLKAFIERELARR